MVRITRVNKFFSLVLLKVVLPQNNNRGFSLSLFFGFEDEFFEKNQTFLSLFSLVNATHEKREYILSKTRERDAQILYIYLHTPPYIYKYILISPPRVREREERERERERIYKR